MNARLARMRGEIYLVGYEGMIYKLDLSNASFGDAGGNVVRTLHRFARRKG